MLNEKETMTRLSTIELFKKSLKFSAAHFTVFSSTDRENLHGHDYGVHASLTTIVKDEGLSFDYRFYEKKLYALCRTLDKAVLVAQLCKHLKVTEEGEYCCIYFNTEKIMLLKRDVNVLPIRNITVEELSYWFLQKLLLDKEQLDDHRIQKIEIKIHSGLGRSGSATWTREITTS